MVCTLKFVGVCLVVLCGVLNVVGDDYVCFVEVCTLKVVVVVCFVMVCTLKVVGGFL